MDSDAKKILRVVGISIFFLFIIIYAFFRSYDLIFGLKITGLNITDNASFTENTQKITGNAKNATNLTLNGREISIDQAGNFSEDIILALGYNIISIKAKDKFGHIDEKNYKLILLAPVTE